MPIVADPSAILGVVYEDEDSAFAASVIDAISTDLGVVPTLFWFEIRNVLLVSERRRRITPDRTREFLAALAELPFEVDDTPQEAGVFELARRHGLTIYDAAYLELARRRGLPLATLDGALSKAAKKAGVAVWKG